MTSAVSASASNGATEIADYDVYNGATMAYMYIVDTLSRNGCETEVNLTGLAADTCFFQTKPTGSNSLEFNVAVK